jgi:hypothetical protein
MYRSLHPLEPRRARVNCVRTTHLALDYPVKETRAAAAGTNVAQYSRKYVR